MIDNIEILAKSSYIIAAIFGSAYTHQWKEAIKYLTIVLKFWSLKHLN